MFSLKLKTKNQPSSRKLVLVLAAAVLVLGFSVKASFAKPDILAPGTAITTEFQQMIDSAPNTIKAPNGTEVSKSEVQKMIAYGKMPTSPSEWGAVNKVFGGYTQDEINKAGIQYANQFVPTRSALTVWIASLLGNVDTDTAMLDKWKKGENVEAKSATQKQNAAVDLPLARAADATTSYLAEKVWDVVIGVLSIIAYFCKEFVSYGAQVLDLTLDPNLYNFTSNNMIVKGWVIVRDVCNLFFLLVLLFIAICTILKIEKYHAKKTLLMLIIMALLINFSKPIAIFIFDGSQLLMNMFLRQMGQTGTGTSASTVITQATNIANIVYNTLPTGTTGATIAVQYLFAVVFLFMLAVAYFVTAIMLLVRIIVVMMLIIVSPFAFFAAIVPDFSKMSSSWWSSLFEYSYYGPAAAFFLLLATGLSDALPYVTRATNTTQTTLGITISNILHYLTVIIFLYASIFMAKKFGGGAGAAIVGNANKFMKWGAGMTKTGGVWGAGARITGAADVYKGVKGGIAKQPGWRILTKEGREAKSKERQEKWEEKIAPFNISNVRKKAKEMENDAQGKIDAGVRKGNAAAIHEASRRGTLTVDQMQDPRVKKLMQQNPDFQKDIFKNLADKGQSYKQAEFQAIDQIGAPGTLNGTRMDAINGEIYKNTSNNKLVEQDLAGALHNERDRGGTFINDRLTQYHAANPTGFDQLYNRATNQHTITMLNNIKAGRPALTGIPHP